MRPGRSTEPIWRTRIVAEWNTAEDGLEVWVVQEEYDTDDTWLGMRVLDGHGQWGKWITDQGVFLGASTQILRGDAVRGIALLPRWAASALSTKPAPKPSKLTPEALESMRKAIEKAHRARGAPMHVSPAVRDYMADMEHEFSIEMEKEFIHGSKGKTNDLGGMVGSFDGQRITGPDGRPYRWVQAQKRWLVAATGV